MNTHVWACWSDRARAHICTEWCGRVCVSVYLWVYSVCVHSVFMHILACTNVCTHTQVTAAHSNPLACVCLCLFPCVHAQGLRVCAHVACLGTCVCRFTGVGGAPAVGTGGRWAWPHLAPHGLLWKVLGRDPPGTAAVPFTIRGPHGTWCKYSNPNFR